MGEHKGWRVRQDKRRKTWRGEALKPGTGEYDSRTFRGPTAERDARTWARAEAARRLTNRPARHQAIHPAIPDQARTADGARDYLADLLARGRSPSHLRNVERTLVAVAKIAPDLASPAAGAAIERWLNGLVGGADPVAPSSRNRYLVEVRAFCQWLIRRDRLERDPTRAIERASVPAVLRPQFSLAELVRLLSMPTPDSQYHRRLALLVYAGLRSDEAAAITWGCVDLVGRSLTIRKHAGHRLKRNRERIVPLQAELAVILGQPGAADQRVAPARDRNDRRAFADYLGDCGVPAAGRSPHSARHTYAGLMTATGVPGPLLSAYLGHTSAATTMIYTQLAAAHVRAVEGWGRGELRILGG